MLGGEDADRLDVTGRGRAADCVQLEAELLSSQRSSVTAVHVQSEELKHTAQDESLSLALCVEPEGRVAGVVLLVEGI